MRLRQIDDFLDLLKALGARPNMEARSDFEWIM